MDTRQAVKQGIFQGAKSFRTLKVLQRIPPLKPACHKVKSLVPF